MEPERKPISATQLDSMTPDQRHAAIRERIVTSLDDPPSEFRDRVIATAERLAADRTTASISAGSKLRNPPRNKPLEVTPV